MKKAKTEPDAPNAGAIAVDLLEALHARGIPAKFEPVRHEPERGGYVHGAGVPIEIKAKREANAPRFASAKIVGYTITVGDYRNAKRFPPRKAGHDFAAIAEEVVRQREHEKVSADRERDRRAKVEEMARRLAEVVESLGISDRKFIGWASVSTHSNLEIEFPAILRLTIDQARAILAAARDAGVE